MHSSDYRNILEQIVHSDLYGSYIDEKNIEDIYRYLKESDSFFTALRNLIYLRTNETLYAYEKYINKFFLLSPIPIRLEVLNFQEQYSDIIKEDNTFIAIWNSISYEEKISYLENKKNYTSLDIEFITLVINDISLDNNIKLQTLLTNEKIKHKIDSYSIALSHADFAISLDQFDFWKLFTKESYTQKVLKKCKSFSSFLSLYKKNKQIYELLMDNGLRFYTKDNKRIYSFLLENHHFIGKFHKQYIKLFSIVEITELSKDTHLDNVSYSVIMQELFQYNPENASFYFNEKSLTKCAKHSISIFPFSNMNDELRNIIFSDYSLFNRFIDTIMVEAILTYFGEDAIVSILRDDLFIKEISSYAIHLLLNKLSFKSTFNMLQRKDILNKIDNLNNKVESKDIVFIPGFLDSPSLVYKANPRMLYHMICLLNKEDTTYYITLPYISSSLSNYEIIEILLEKDISLQLVLSTPFLFKKFSVADYIYYIDRSISPHFDFSIFLNKEFTKMLFPIEEIYADSIDFEEVNYLYETIFMKSLLSHQDSKLSFNSYKAILISYLTLGLEETLNLVNKGNREITFTEVKELQKDIIDEKILLFKENNSSLFQNLPKKLFNQLEAIGVCKNKKEFEKKIKGNTFISNLIQLLIDNDYDTYSHIIDIFYSYLLFHEENTYLASKELYDYIHEFVVFYIQHILTNYNKEFDTIFLKNFKPREKVLYTKRKEVGNDYLHKIKLKLFVQALTSPKIEEYKNYFITNYPLNLLKEKYLYYLNHDIVDFSNLITHVLIPLANERFDKENCLMQLGIKKPKDYDAYIQYKEDLQTITELNSIMDSYQNKYKPEELLSVLNFICYGSPILFKVKEKDKNIFSKLRERIISFCGEVYVDKTKFKFIYKSLTDIYITDVILEYIRYLEILDDIITKTNRFIKRYMHTNNIKQIYEKEYLKVVNSFSYTFPISDKNYELKTRVFSLSDIEKIFSGYELSQYKPFDASLKQFLFQNKNIVMVAEGYYEGIVDHFGLLMNHFEDIKKKAKELHIENITLLQADNLLSILTSDEDRFSDLLEKDILYNVMSEGYYEVNDLAIRLRMLSSLYQDAFSHISSSIPYLSYQKDHYTIKVLNSYEKDMFIGLGDTLYKVGTVGNDFFCYSILHKNGCQVGIYDHSSLIGKILGVRNGNTLYFHMLEGHFTTSIISLLKEFGNKIIDFTKEDAEPIELITIVNNINYNDTLGPIIDSTICKVISSPILTENKNYIEFMNLSYLLHKKEDIITNYNYQISTLLASSIALDKKSFRVYDPEQKYLRPRNKVLKLSNSIGEEEIHKINCILYMMKKEGLLSSTDVFQLSNMDTIYLGDDFVIFLTNSKEIMQYVLPYDDRALNEVNLILQSM